MNAKLTGFGFLTLFLVLATATAAAQNIYLAQGVYKWVDEDGVTSYGETPPDGVPAVQTDIRYSRTSPVAMQARLEEQKAVSNAVATRKEDESRAVDEEIRIEAENKKIREANCQLALERQKKYDEARRLYRPTEDGGRDYLTDQELDAERAEANLAVNEWCMKK